MMKVVFKKFFQYQLGRFEVEVLCAASVIQMFLISFDNILFLVVVEDCGDRV